MERSPGRCTTAPDLRRPLNFLDTNFFIRSPEELPPAGKLPTTRRWITEAVRTELQEKLQWGYAAAARHLEVLDYYRMQADFENVCPAFYWTFTHMFNPSNIGDLDKWMNDYIVSRHYLHGGPTEQEVREFEDFRKAYASNKAAFSDGTEKPAGYRRLEELEARAAKKARRAARDQHPSQVRDALNLALIAFNALRAKHDSVLYTTDGDPVSMLLGWVKAFADHQALIDVSERTCTPQQRRAVLEGEPVQLQIDWETMARRSADICADLFAQRTGKGVTHVVVRHWNVAERQLEDFWVSLTPHHAEWLTNTTGTLLCPTEQERSHRNWLFLQYEPHTEHGDLVLKVFVRRKGGAPQRWSTIEHDQQCRYRQMHLENRLGEFSGFGNRAGW